jgi:hypothetical protein
LRDLLRSELDASWRIVIVLGAVVVGVFAVLMPIVGLISAALLLGFGVGVMLRGSHRGPPRRAELSHGEDGRHRVLVIANQAVSSRVLLAEIQSRCEGGRGEVLIVAPALTASRAAIWASDVDPSIEDARRRLELSLQAAAEVGLRARGQVGDPDPGVALEDALRSFAADEIVIWTHTPDRSPWLEHGVVQRAREAVDLPLTHVVIDSEGESARSDARTSSPEPKA